MDWIIAMKMSIIDDRKSQKIDEKVINKERVWEVYEDLELSSKQTIDQNSILVPFAFLNKKV